ncbi:MAG: acetyltransferase [Balneola sp.]|jgi:sugar O-acyltransferase (sialic acid O-acetyltransferase NeuD family)
MSTDFVIIGYSGHAYVVIESAFESNLNIIGYTMPQISNSNPYDLSYLGSESDANFIGLKKDFNYILGVGDNETRERIYNNLIADGEKVSSVINPSAKIAESVVIGKGVFISAGAIINPQSKIKEAAIINSGAIVEHECEIDKASHIGPGAVLCGNVYVGKRTFVGANSVVKQGVKIGHDAIIGAGAVVLSDVADNDKLVGNPGRLL